MEPKQFSRGKIFHNLVQKDWAGTIEGKVVVAEHGIDLLQLLQSSKRIRRGRVDIFINKMDDFVTVIEIKSTDWEKIKNRKKLLGSHRRQILKYVDHYLFEEKINVCAALLYPKPPKDDIKKEIEQYLNEYSLQVCWYCEG